MLKICVDPLHGHSTPTKSKKRMGPNINELLPPSIIVTGICRPETKWMSIVCVPSKTERHFPFSLKIYIYIYINEMRVGGGYNLFAPPPFHKLRSFVYYGNKLIRDSPTNIVWAPFILYRSLNKPQ